jgi:hypothetical protein
VMLDKALLRGGVLATALVSNCSFSRVLVDEEDVAWAELAPASPGAGVEAGAGVEVEVGGGADGAANTGTNRRRWLAAARILFSPGTDVVLLPTEMLVSSGTGILLSPADPRLLFAGVGRVSSTGEVDAFDLDLGFSDLFEAALCLVEDALLPISVCESGLLEVDALGLSAEISGFVSTDRFGLCSDSAACLLLSTGGVRNARSSTSNSVVSEHNDGVGTSRSAVASSETDPDPEPLIRRRTADSG